MLPSSGTLTMSADWQCLGGAGMRWRARGHMKWRRSHVGARHSVSGYCSQNSGHVFAFRVQVGKACGSRSLWANTLERGRPRHGICTGRDTTCDLQMEAANCDMCGISNRTIAYIHGLGKVYSMRSGDNGQTLINRPSDSPESAFSSLCSILRHCKPTSASFNFDPAACTFAHDYTAVHE